MAINFGGTLASAAMSAAEKRKLPIPMPEKPDEDEYENILAAAVKEWKERMLAGLFGLTEDDIQEKIGEFKAMFKPAEDPLRCTEAEMKAFYEKLAQFEAMLREMAKAQSSEMLITSSGANDENTNENVIAEFMQSRLPSNPQLQSRLNAAG